MRPEVKDHLYEQYHFKLRLGFTAFAVIGLFVLLAFRFFYLQIAQYAHYQTLAENNRISLVPIVANRGLIIDKNGVVLAHNFFVYTLEITPSKVKDLEATITGLSQFVEIGDPGQIGLGMVEIGDLMILHRVSRLAEDDRDGPGQRLGSACGVGGADDQHRDIEIDQILGQHRQPVDIAIGIAEFDAAILALDKSLLRQTLAEGRDIDCIGGAVAGDRLQIADDRQHRCIIGEAKPRAAAQRGQAEHKPARQQTPARKRSMAIASRHHHAALCGNPGIHARMKCRHCRVTAQAEPALCA